MDIDGKKRHNAWYQSLEEIQKREQEESRANKQRANGELIKAVEQNDLTGVSTWLARGADPNARRGSREETPLFLAVGYEHGDRRIAELLLDRGANVHARDAYGRTPLHDAASGRDESSLALLLDRGADANLQDKRGETPLHVAARRGEEAHIRVLLRGGAEIDARDVVGRTPLHCAAVPPRIDQLTFLVAEGADVSIRDDMGRTPLDVLRVLRGDREWCKKHNTPLESLEGQQWELLRGVLGGFTTVKVTEAWRDTLVVRVEGHHGRYTAALQEGRERGALVVPPKAIGKR